MSVALCLTWGPLYPFCHKYIQDHGVELLEKISQGIDPEKICKEYICLASRKHLITKQQAIKADLCTICIDTLNTTKTLLAQNVTEEKIINFISITICLGLGPLALPCRNFVKEKGPIILASLSQDIDPQVICKQITLCGENIFQKLFLRLNKK